MTLYDDSSDFDRRKMLWRGREEHEEHLLYQSRLFAETHELMAHTRLTLSTILDSIGESGSIAQVIRDSADQTTVQAYHFDEISTETLNAGRRHLLEDQW